MRNSSFSRRLGAKTALGALAAALALISAPLGAQTLSSGNSGLGLFNADGTLGFTVSEQVGHTFKSDLNNGSNGDMAVTRSFTNVKYDRKWDVNHLTASLGYTYDSYSFSGIPASPWGNVQKLGMSVLYTRDKIIGDEWGLLALVSGGFAAETSTSLGQGGQFSMGVAATFQMNQDIWFYLGPMYMTRLEDSGAWYPMAGVDWQIDPQWHLRTFNGATITYDVFTDGQTVLDATVEYKSDWFRIDTQPGGDAAVNATAMVINFGVTQKFLTNFFVRGYVEGQFFRTFQYHVNGNSANSFDADAGLGLGIQVGASF